MGNRPAEAGKHSLRADSANTDNGRLGPPVCRMRPVGARPPPFSPMALYDAIIANFATQPTSKRMKTLNQIYVAPSDATKINRVVPGTPMVPVTQRQEAVMLNNTNGSKVTNGMTPAQLAAFDAKRSVPTVVSSPGKSPYSTQSGRRYVYENATKPIGEAVRAETGGNSFYGNPLNWPGIAGAWAVDKAADAVTGSGKGFAGLFDDGTEVGNMLADNPDVAGLLNPGWLIGPSVARNWFVRPARRSMAGLNSVDKPNMPAETNGGVPALLGSDIHAKGRREAAYETLKGMIGEEAAEHVTYEPQSKLAKRLIGASGHDGAAWSGLVPSAGYYLGELTADNPILGPASNYVGYLNRTLKQPVPAVMETPVPVFLPTNNVSGKYIRDMKAAFLSPRNKTANEVANIAVHEFAGHGTETLLPNDAVAEWYRTVDNDAVKNHLNGIFRNAEDRATAFRKLRQFGEWYEARATGLEARQNILRANGIDPAAYEWGEWFGGKGKEMLDKLTDDELMGMVGDTNGYGKAYMRAYHEAKATAPEEAKALADTWRHSLANSYSGPVTADTNAGALNLTRRRLMNGGFDNMGIPESERPYILAKRPVADDATPAWTGGAFNPYANIHRMTERRKARQAAGLGHGDPDMPGETGFTLAGEHDPTMLIPASLPQGGEAAAHEYNHYLNSLSHNPQAPLTNIKPMTTTIETPYGRQPFDITGYFMDNNQTELLSRFTQLKNYFGFTDGNRKITPELWEYAKEHYVKDTGTDNFMTEFFRFVDANKDNLGVILDWGSRWSAGLAPHARADTARHGGLIRRRRI